jgi:hypothetical protein
MIGARATAVQRRLDHHWMPACTHRHHLTPPPEILALAGRQGECIKALDMSC